MSEVKMPSYSKAVGEGLVTPELAGLMDAARAASQAATANHVKGAPSSEAATFGALDACAVLLVRFYGPSEAGEVLRHYAAVCEARGRS